jgi:hypothetical protein
VIEDESEALAFELGSGFSEITEPLTFFFGGLAVHADEDASVRKSVREVADAGHDLGTPRREHGEARGGVGRAIARILARYP